MPGNKHRLLWVDRIGSDEIDTKSIFFWAKANRKIEVKRWQRRLHYRFSMRQSQRIIIAATFAVGVLIAQKPEVAEVASLERLSKELRLLEIELTALRLETIELRLKKIEKQIARIAVEKRKSEWEETTSRSELVSISEQLARSELTAEERTALEAMQTGLLGDGHALIRERLIAARDRELALRGLLENEKLAALELRQRLKRLRSEE